MRAMEDPDLPKQHHGHPAPLSLTDVRPKRKEKRLNISPRDIGAHRMGKDGFEGSSVRSSHRRNGTTPRYHPQVQAWNELPTRQGAND
jgi:hypothetical protein